MCATQLYTATGGGRKGEALLEARNAEGLTGGQMATRAKRTEVTKRLRRLSWSTWAARGMLMALVILALALLLVTGQSRAPRAQPKFPVSWAFPSCARYILRRFTDVLVSKLRMETPGQGSTKWRPPAET